MDREIIKDEAAEDSLHSVRVNFMMLQIISFDKESTFSFFF